MRKVSESEFEHYCADLTNRKVIFATANQPSTNSTLSAVTVFNNIKLMYAPCSLWITDGDKRNYMLLNGVTEIFIDEETLSCGDIIQVRCTNDAGGDDIFVFLID